MPALDFNVPATSLINLDGQHCPNPAAPCGVADWPNVMTYQRFAGSFAPMPAETTRVTHYRISPTQSDLYLLFEITGGFASDQARLSIALNPTTTTTTSHLFIIQPFANGAPPVGSGASAAPAPIVHWTGTMAGWTPAAAPLPADFTAQVAHKVANGYWGVEVRIHLPTYGILVGSDRFYMATHYKTQYTSVSALVSEWAPSTAEPLSGNPDSTENNPALWTLFSFGQRCSPDVYIYSEWNTCADIYINQKDANARRIAINNTNEFHADVHGDVDVGHPELGGITADNVLVYMDISHLGNGNPPFAMNYPHTNTNINWEGATADLATATPEPPTPFSVAAGAVNTDTRVSWKPANESPNPFADGEHVCVNAYVYFKDDPFLDNNYGQCNMEFVSVVMGRMMAFRMGVGRGFRQFRKEQASELYLVPLIVNSPIQTPERWQVKLQGGGLERVGNLYRMSLPAPGESHEVAVTFVPPLGASWPDTLKEVPGVDRVTRAFYGNRPLVIFRTLKGRRWRDGDREQLILSPASYVGYALDVKRQ